MKLNKEADRTTHQNGLSNIAFNVEVQGPKSPSKQLLGSTPNNIVATQNSITDRPEAHPHEQASRGNVFIIRN